MHQVVAAALQFIGEDIETPHFEIGPLASVQKARIEIGSHDAALRADALAHPLRHRTGAGADLQAFPPISYSYRCEPPFCDWIENVAESLQALSFRSLG